VAASTSRSPRDPSRISSLAFPVDGIVLKVLQQIEAIQAALSNYLITFFGVPIAAIWLGEKLGAASVIGSALVLASTLLITLWTPAEHPTEEVGCDATLPAHRNDG
jgi:hypothetical protein